MSHTTSPKKPQSAYFIFSKEKRPEYKQKFPSLSAQDITKELARAFKELAPTDRKSWDEKSAKEKEEYEKVLQAHIHSPRKHKSKSDLSDDSKKTKQSPIMTRHQSHEKENPHLTRSHGSAQDVTTSETKHHETKPTERGPSPKRPSKEKKSPSTTPKSGTKKSKAEKMPEAEKLEEAKIEKLNQKADDIPEMGALQPENRNISTEEAVENFREQSKEEIENKEPQHPWMTGTEKTFVERRSDDEEESSKEEIMQEERLPTTEMQEKEIKERKSPMRVDQPELNDSEEIQIPRRDPLHVFPEHHVPIHHEDKMEQEGQDAENVDPNKGGSDNEKSRKVKVLDTNKKTGENGRKSPVTGSMVS